MRTTMNELRRALSNTAVSLIGQAVTWTSSFLLTVAYGRFLGDTKFGELYLAISLTALIGVPVEFGFNQQLTRDVAKAPDKALRYVSNTLLIKLCLWSVLFSALLGLTWVLRYGSDERLLVAICGLTLLSASISSMFTALYAALQRQIYPVVGAILEKGGDALLGILLLRQGAGVQVMALVLLGGSLASVAWQALWFARRVGVGFALDIGLIRDLLRTSVPFVIAGVLGVLYYRIDAVLLSLFASATVVGWYGAGYRLFDTLSFLPNIVITAVMYPLFSKYSVNAEARLKQAVEKTANLLLLCGIPMAVGLVVAAPNIVGFLYHRAEFAQTVPVIQALAPGLLFMYVTSIGGAVLASTNQEKKLPIMALSALLFNLTLNLVLIPRYLHVGAAIVTSLTELLLLCLAIVLVPRRLLPVRSLNVAGRALIASVFMAAAVLALSKLPIVVIVPIALAVYVAAATALKTIPRDDLRAVTSALSSKLHSRGVTASPAQEMK